ncbi:hypothetical protein BKA57DRAFT_473473 [Linnemannia elongata]|nr:hypothetical protein BKA57DRAFT_473473 [Linnemannia elongata]
MKYCFLLSFYSSSTCPYLLLVTVGKGVLCSPFFSFRPRIVQIVRVWRVKKNERGVALDRSLGNKFDRGCKRRQQLRRPTSMAIANESKDG